MSEACIGGLFKFTVYWTRVYLYFVCTVLYGLPFGVYNIKYIFYYWISILYYLCILCFYFFKMIMIVYSIIKTEKKF
jgi:hypothetical protein